jgi:hypothetical protein
MGHEVGHGVGHGCSKKNVRQMFLAFYQMSVENTTGKWGDLACGAKYDSGKV